MQIEMMVPATREVTQKDMLKMIRDIRTNEYRLRMNSISSTWFKYLDCVFRNSVEIPIPHIGIHNYLIY